MTARSTRLTLVAAVVGLTAWMTLCDRYFHLTTGTVVHFWRPFMGEQTVWVIPIFGLAAIAFVTTAPRFAAPEARPSRGGTSLLGAQRRAWGIVVELLVMTTVYAASGFVGFDHGSLVTVAFVSLFALRLLASRDRGTLVTIALLLAVAGPFFESLQWQLGMFRYTQPDVIGVPWWLFPFYANGAWAVRELGALLKR
jgi:hypothetical protein